MISSPAGNDLLFDEGSLEQGKHFNNKLWNALKLIKMWAIRRAQDEGMSAVGSLEREAVHNTSLLNGLRIV